MENMTADYRAKVEMARQTRDDCCQAAREMTVSELLDQHIAKSARLLGSLNDLKNALPASFLNSGASRLAGIVGL